VGFVICIVGNAVVAVSKGKSAGSMSFISLPLLSILDGGLLSFLLLLLESSYVIP